MMLVERGDSMAHRFCFSGTIDTHRCKKISCALSKVLGKNYSVDPGTPDARSVWWRTLKNAPQNTVSLPQSRLCTIQPRPPFNGRLLSCAETQVGANSRSIVLALCAVREVLAFLPVASV